MPNQSGKAVEMTGRGKRGKPNSGFPLFPPPLEIAPRFPHSHRLDDDSPCPERKNRRHRILERSPYFDPAYLGLLQAHLSIGICSRGGHTGRTLVLTGASPLDQV